MSFGLSSKFMYGMAPRGLLGGVVVPPVAVNDNLIANPIAAPVTVNNPPADLIHDTGALDHSVEFTTTINTTEFQVFPLWQNSLNNIRYERGSGVGRLAVNRYINGGEFNAKDAILTGFVLSAPVLIKIARQDGFYRFYIDNVESLPHQWVTAGDSSITLTNFMRINWTVGTRPASYTFRTGGVVFAIASNSYNTVTDKATFTVNYGGTPVGYEVYKNGVYRGRAVKLTNSVAGTATYETPVLGVVGAENVEIREVGVLANSGVFPVEKAVAAKFGMNIAGDTYFGSERLMSNLLQSSQWLNGNGGEGLALGSTHVNADGDLISMPPAGFSNRGMIRPGGTSPVRLRMKAKGTFTWSLYVELPTTVTNVVNSVDGLFTVMEFDLASTYAPAGKNITLVINSMSTPITELDCRETTRLTTEVIAQEYIDRHKIYNGPLRLMDLMFANQNALVQATPPTWAQRGLPGKFYTNTSGGMVPEYLVEIVNRINPSVAWFNPLMYTDDASLASFFTFLHANVNPGIQIAIESGNEPQNNFFPIYNVMRTKALAAGRITQAEHDNAFEAVLKEQAFQNTRMMTVLDNLNFPVGRFIRVLGCLGQGQYAPQKIYEVHGSTKFDVVAHAPYIGGDLMNAVAPLNYTETTDLTVAFARMYALLDRDFIQLKASNTYVKGIGRRHWCYEWQQHYILPGGATPAQIAFNTAFQTDDRMRQFIYDGCIRWASDCGDALVCYSSVGPPNAFGSWGFLAYQGATALESPKLTGMLQAIAATSGAATFALSTAITANEGNAGTTNYVFTLTRSTNTTIVSTVNWAVTGSGANPANAADFVGGALPSGQVSFAIGETAKTITVPVAGDVTVEANETFTVTVSNPVPAGTITTATAIGTITDDDASGAVDLEATSTTTFAGVANAATLQTVPGWLRYNAGASTENQNAMVIQGEQLTQTAGDFTGNGAQLFALEQAGATVGQSIEFDFVSGSDFVVCVNSTDNDNLLYCKKSGASQIDIGKRVAGVSTGLGDTNAYTPIAGERIRFFQVDRKVGVWRIRANGIIDVIIAANSIDTGGTYPLGLRAGRTTFAGDAVMDNIVIKTLKGSITTMTQPLFRPSEFINLGSAASDYTGVTDYPMTGTYSVSNGLTTVPTGFQRRIRNLTTGALVSDWSDCTAFTAPGGVNVTSQFGIPATSSDCQIVYRMKNNTSVEFTALMVGGTNSVACGPTVGIYGQSNAGAATGPGTANADLDVYRSANTYSFSGPFIDGGSRVWLKNTNTIQSIVLARQLFNYFGLTSGVCGGGLPSQPVTALVKGGPGVFADPYNGNVVTPGYTMLNNHLVAAGAVGRIASWISDQGEAEGDSFDPLNDTVYGNNWTQLFSDLRTDFSGNRNVLAMITITGRITNPVSGDQDNSLPKVRAKQKQMTTTIPNAVISHTNVGVLMSDAYHYSIATNGMVEKLRRAGKSFAFASGASGYKGSGAQTLTGTRAAAVITMPITANGATSYSALSGLDSVTAASGAALTSWQVSADDFVTFLTITSVALSGTNVVLTLAATPAGAVKVRNHQGKSPDVSSWVFGTYADAFKIALEPLFIPITVT